MDRRYLGMEEPRRITVDPEVAHLLDSMKVVIRARKSEIVEVSLMLLADALAEACREEGVTYAQAMASIAKSFGDVDDERASVHLRLLLQVHPARGEVVVPLDAQAGGRGDGLHDVPAEALEGGAGRSLRFFRR